MAACICADARLESGYSEALRGEKAALLLTDPPYCLLTRRRKGGDLRDARARKIDREPVVRFESVRDYRAFTEAWLPRAISHLAPEAFVILWTNLLGKEPLLETARTCGYSELWGEFVWGKRTTEKNQNEFTLRVYEVGLVLSRRPQPKPDPADPAKPWSVVSAYDEGEGVATGDHPHHKPFQVIEPLIRSWSRPGDVVLDPFAGSGSIPAATVKLSRRTACMELKPEWAEQVSKRLSAIS